MRDGADWILAAISNALAAAPDSIVADSRTALAGLTCGAAEFRRPAPRRHPACVFLPETVGATLAHASELAAAIAAVEDGLNWQADPLLPEPGAAALAELIGPSGFFAADHVRLALLLLAPGRSQPLHHHAAAELVWCLSGPAQWIGAEGKRFCAAGSFAAADGGVPHALAALGAPLLAVCCWTRDTLQDV